MATHINSHHYLGPLLGQMLCQYSFNRTLQSCKIGFVNFFPQIKKQRPQGAQKRYTEHRRAQVEAGMLSVPLMTRSIHKAHNEEQKSAQKLGVMIKQRGL